MWNTVFLTAALALGQPGDALPDIAPVAPPPISAGDAAISKRSCRAPGGRPRRAAGVGPRRTRRPWRRSRPPPNFRLRRPNPCAADASPH